MHYKSIFISDVHLGSRGCKAHELSHFLHTNTCDTLYLLGDIIDGWKMQQNRLRWKQSHTNVVRRILTKAKEGTDVVYIVGNHDEFFRPFVKYTLQFGRISIHNQYLHEGIDGKRYLLVHGDLFDGISKIAPWMSFLGDRAYDFILNLNTKFNWLRHRLGFGYWSVSQYLKSKVKRAVSFIWDFEDNLTAYASKRGFDGVICGHIHSPTIKVIDNIIYMNTGDWVESLSALVEHEDGRWELIYYHGQYPESGEWGSDDIPEYSEGSE